MSALVPLYAAEQPLYEFIQHHQLLSPQQLNVALKVQHRTLGPLDLILWQLGFLSSQELTWLWQLRHQSDLQSVSSV